MSVDEIPSEARLPTKHGEFNIRVFHESETGLDHVALTMGDMQGPVALFPDVFDFDRLRVRYRGFCLGQLLIS